MTAEITSDDIFHYFSDHENIAFSIPLMQALGIYATAWITFYFLKEKWRGKDPKDRTGERLFHAANMKAFIREMGRMPTLRQNRVIDQLLSLELLSVKEIKGEAYFSLPLAGVLAFVRDHYRRNDKDPLTTDDIVRQYRKDYKEVLKDDA